MKTTLYLIFLLILLGCNNKSNLNTTVINQQNHRDLSNQIFKNKRDTTKLKALIVKADSSFYEKGVIQALDLLGVNYRNLSLYEKSISYHKLALDKAYKIKDTVQLIYAQNNLGTVYRRIDDFPSATKSYLEVINLIDKQSKKSKKSIKSKAIAYNGLGNISLSQKDNNAALNYFKLALDTEIKLNSWRGMAMDYLCLGSTFLNLNNIDSAKYYYGKSLEININNESAIGQAICYKDLGYLFFGEKQYNLALSNFRNSLKEAEKSKEPFYIVGGLISVGKGLLAIKHYNKAFTYLKKGYDLALKIKSKSELASSSLLLSKYFELMNNNSEALKWYKKSKAIQEEIYNNENSNRIAILNAKFDVANKQRIIDKQKNNIEQTNNRLTITIIITISIIIIFILSLLAILFLYKQNKTKQKAHKIILEQKLLRSQMNPHFIFNSLGAIQSYMYKNDMNSAAKYLGDFSSLMRSVLDNSREDLISLDQEINTLKHYLELEKLRMNNRFNFEINMDSKIESEFEYIPPMILQPFVENSIIHGFRGINYSGLIKLDISKVEDLYEFKIFDNGVGYQKNNSLKKHKSHGLNIFKERILKTYGKNYTELNILQSEKDNGTIISFKLPISKN